MFELLFQLLFWGGIVVLVLWLVRRDRARSYVDYDSKSYAQGYWDGYRAHQKESGVKTPEPPMNQPAVQSVQPVSITPTADTKEKRDIQNINTTLYVASFLLVAAAALFIGTALDPGVKFVGTWLITLAFYVVGLVLYDRIPRLRPAAVAFVGTGLALLPFTGLALYSFVLPDAALSWLITSIIGVAAFVYATMRLQSQVVAYFAIAFMVSLASASVATLGAALIWYFVVLIAFGSLVTITATAKPTWLPAVFSRPIQEGAQWIVPLALFASLVSAPFLELLDYEVITAISTLYYVTVAVSSPAARSTALFVARALASLFVLLVAYDISDSWVVVGGAMMAIGAAHALISATMLRRNNANNNADETWLWLGLSLLVIAPLFVVSSSNWAQIASLQLIVLLAASVGIAVMLRRYTVLFFGVYALAILPFILGFFVFQSALDAQWVALSYLLLAGAGLYARLLPKVAKQPSLYPVFIASYVTSLTAGLLVSLQLDAGWNTAIWLIASTLVYAAAVIEKQPLITLVGNAFLLAMFGWLLELLNVPGQWRGLMVAWLAFVAFYGMHWLSASQSKYKRHSQLMLWSGIGVAGLAGLISLGNANFDIAIASGLTVIVVALALALEGENRRQLLYYDAAAILATLGLQKIVAEMAPGMDDLVYSHWWALVFAGLAYTYYRVRQSSRAKARLITGLVILSLFSGAAALDTSSAWVGDTSYRLIFLLEHAVLLVAGLAFSYKLLSIWGAVGVVLAVLWLLSGYTFLLLLFVGLSLIAGAVYALLKKTNNP